MRDPLLVGAAVFRLQLLDEPGEVRTVPLRVVLERAWRSRSAQRLAVQRDERHRFQLVPQPAIHREDFPGSRESSQSRSRPFPVRRPVARVLDIQRSAVAAPGQIPRRRHRTSVFETSEESLGSRPRIGKAVEGARLIPRRGQRKPLFASEVQAAPSVLPHGDFVAQSVVRRPPVHGRARRWNPDFQSQLETQVSIRAIPYQVLEIRRALPRGLEGSVLDEIADEGQGVEEGALAAAARADEDLELVEFDIHISQAAVTESLEAADHFVGPGGECRNCDQPGGPARAAYSLRAAVTRAAT